MIATVKAEVTHTCYLSDEQAQMVKDYAEKNGCDLESAVMGLYFAYDVDFPLYDDCVESEFSTVEVEAVEE